VSPRQIFRPLAVLLIAALACATAAAASRRRESRPDLSHDYRSAIVVDAASGRVLFADRAEVESPPASVTKLMTFLLVEQAIRKGEYSLSTVVRIPKRAAEMGGSEAWLMTNEPATIDQLLYLLMVPSANDAAVALAIRTAGSEDAFVDLMNVEARALGMTHSTFHSPHGLPPGRGQRATLSTAHDIALLCRTLLATTDILRYTSTREYDFRHENGVLNKFTNHDHLLANLPGCDGFKTGWYEKAGYSIAVTVQRNGHRVIAVVLGCPQRKLRDAIVTRLVDRAFVALASTPPEPVATARTPASGQVSANTPGPAAANPAAPAPAGAEMIPVPLNAGDKAGVQSPGDSSFTVHVDLPKVRR
jgi:D-alanyl-D-alanine carboxypeptidase